VHVLSQRHDLSRITPGDEKGDLASAKASFEQFLDLESTPRSFEGKGTAMADHAKRLSQLRAGRFLSSRRHLWLGSGCIRYLLPIRDDCCELTSLFTKNRVTPE